MDELTPEKLEAIARRIEEAASEYHAIAHKMRQLGVNMLPVAGFTTLQKATLSRLESPIGSLRRALRSAISNLNEAQPAAKQKPITEAEIQAIEKPIESVSLRETAKAKKKEVAEKPKNSRKKA
jgi:hypothetical protein